MREEFSLWRKNELFLEKKKRKKKLQARSCFVLLVLFLLVLSQERTTVFISIAPFQTRRWEGVSFLKSGIRVFMSFVSSEGKIILCL